VILNVLLTSFVRQRSSECGDDSTLSLCVTGHLSHFGIVNIKNPLSTTVVLRRYNWLQHSIRGQVMLQENSHLLPDSSEISRNYSGLRPWRARALQHNSYNSLFKRRSRQRQYREGDHMKKRPTHSESHGTVRTEEGIHCKISSTRARFSNDEPVISWGPRVAQVYHSILIFCNISRADIFPLFLENIRNTTLTLEGWRD